MSPATIRLPVFPASPRCAPCGGRCCKTCPGSTSPEDWGAPDEAVMVARLTEALATGRWAIDRWIGESWHAEEALHDDVLFVRAAVQGHESSTYPYHGLDDEDDDADAISRWIRGRYPQLYPCTFHGATGCELSHAARPIECRALESGPEGKGCTPHAVGRRERALEWAPYQALLARVMGR